MVGEQGALSSFCLPLSAPHLIDVSRSTVYGKAPPGPYRAPGEDLGETEMEGEKNRKNMRRWASCFLFLHVIGQPFVFQLYKDDIIVFFVFFTWHMHQSHTDDDDDETQNESIYFYWKDPCFVPVVEDWCDKVRAEGKEENKLCELWNWRGSKRQRVVNKSWPLPVGRWTGCCIALIPWASGNTLESL